MGNPYRELINTQTEVRKPDNRFLVNIINVNDQYCNKSKSGKVKSKNKTNLYLSKL